MNETLLPPALAAAFKACADERHGTVNTVLGIGLTVAPFWGAYRGWKFGSGIVSGLLWAAGGYMVTGLVTGVLGLGAFAAVNKDCLVETGVLPTTTRG